MYRVDRNNFYKEQKKATVYTPAGVSKFIYDLVADRIDRGKPILDPCVGRGALLKPFEEAGFRVIGIDVEDQGFKGTRVENYLAVERNDIEQPGLVIMNPPFNVDKKTKEYISRHYCRRPLLPEIWLRKAVELFGKNIPIILFTPYGLRLNQMTTSERWQKFVNGCYPEISSIISLPKNVFENILFHSEILIFNIEKLKGHYFYNGNV